MATVATLPGQQIFAFECLVNIFAMQIFQHVAAQRARMIAGQQLFAKPVTTTVGAKVCKILRLAQCPLDVMMIGTVNRQARLTGNFGENMLPPKSLLFVGRSVFVLSPCALALTVSLLFYSSLLCSRKKFFKTLILFTKKGDNNQHQKKNFGREMDEAH